MAKKSRLQIALEYAAARTVISGLGLLPRRAAVALGRGLGRIAFHVASRLRQTGERNLELAFPDTPARERSRILKCSFISLGRQLGEFSQFRRATPESLREITEYDETGLRHLREAEAAGRGVIFLTGHIGAWELLSFAHSAIERPLSFFVRPLDNPRIEKMVAEIRGRFGNRPIDKTRGLRNALRVLREGGTVGILADLNTQRHEGVFVPFFGRLACTTTGVALLSLHTDAVVIATCAVWDEQRSRYSFRGSAPLEAVRTGDREMDIEANTRRYTAALEAFIRDDPDQWLWVHKRWRTRPPGEPDLYERTG